MVISANSGTLHVSSYSAKLIFISHFSCLQNFNKFFLRSGYGLIKSDVTSQNLEKIFPGVTAYLQEKCSLEDATPSDTIFPLEMLFSLIETSHTLDFQRCITLLDLSVEIQRQKAERTRLFEEFADPHPNIIFRKRKNSWFSQLVYTRINSNHYHVSYVSSIRFAEVSLRIDQIHF